MNDIEDTFHLGVKALIQDNEKKILLLRVNLKALTETKESYWDIPGGRVQRGHTVEETLIREIQEETGIIDLVNIKQFTMVLSNIRIPLKPLDVGLVLAIYTCEIGDNEEIKISNEHTEAKWFGLEEAAELLSIKYPSSFTEQLKNF